MIARERVRTRQRERDIATCTPGAWQQQQLDSTQITLNEEAARALRSCSTQTSRAFLCLAQHPQQRLCVHNAARDKAKKTERAHDECARECARACAREREAERQHEERERGRVSEREGGMLRLARPLHLCNAA